MPKVKKYFYSQGNLTNYDFFWKKTNFLDFLAQIKIDFLLFHFYE